MLCADLRRDKLYWWDSTTGMCLDLGFASACSSHDFSKKKTGELEKRSDTLRKTKLEKMAERKPNIKYADINDDMQH